jgi:hypothetical protein
VPHKKFIRSALVTHQLNKGTPWEHQPPISSRNNYGPILEDKILLEIIEGLIKDNIGGLFDYVNFAMIEPHNLKHCQAIVNFCIDNKAQKMAVMYMLYREFDNWNLNEKGRQGYNESNFEQVHQYYPN